MNTVTAQRDARRAHCKNLFRQFSGRDNPSQLRKFRHAGPRYEVVVAFHAGGRDWKPGELISGMRPQFLGMMEHNGFIKKSVDAPEAVAPKVVAPKPKKVKAKVAEPKRAVKKKSTRAKPKKRKMIVKAAAKKKVVKKAKTKKPRQRGKKVKA